MLLISFSPFGVALYLIGHTFQTLFLINIKKNKFSNINANPFFKDCKNIILYLISFIIYIIASFYSTPSACGVTFAFFIILYNLYYFIITKEVPLYPYLYYSSLCISLISIIINILHCPPSFDNIGIIEVIHLLYSPVGIILTFLYITLQIAFCFLSYQGNQFASVLNASLSFASAINLTKLIGNCITLTLRIENQFVIFMFYPFLLSFVVSVVFYFYAIKKVMLLETCGVYQGLFYFSYLIFQISSATLLYGEPMLLNPIQIGLFLSSAVLLIFSMFFMSCSAWTPLQSKQNHSLYNQMQLN